MSRLNDEQKIQIAELHVEGMSNRAIARQMGISDNTVRSVLLRDPETAQNCAHKKAQMVRSVLEHMDTQREKVCATIDALLSGIGDIEKIDKATVPQLATALGILVDKYTSRVAERFDSVSDNNLFSALDANAPGDWADGDDVPEDDDA